MAKWNEITSKGHARVAALAIAAVMALSGSAKADVIGFTGLNGAVSNPLALPGATFTAVGGFNVVGFGGLCASPTAANSANCAKDLEVNFDAASSGVSFTFWANNIRTVGADIGDVSIFSGMTLLGLVNLIVLDTDSSPTSGDLVDLTGYTGITRLLISNTDPGGLLYDDFTFSQQAAVPEPATWAMMLIGFCGLGAMLRRRRGLARAA